MASILFFASEAALPGASGANRSAYAVAKTGVVALMRAIAAEERANRRPRERRRADVDSNGGERQRDMGSDVRYVEREAGRRGRDVPLFAAASAINGVVLPLS